MSPELYFPDFDDYTVSDSDFVIEYNPNTPTTAEKLKNESEKTRKDSEASSDGN